MSFLKNIFSNLFGSAPENKIEDIKTACIFLGPYRNLTTLTASILALHPRCAVLNHAGGRIFSEPDLNFIENYSSEKFDNFCRFAIGASRSGKRGNFGGSIVYSHAFDLPEMSEAYKKRYGKKLSKEKVECIVWKESQRVTNLLIEDNSRLEKILKENSKIKFLLPVRHPLDCAASNIKTNHAKHLGNSNAQNIAEVVEAMFKEFVWFLDLQKKHPNRFFYFTENNFTSHTVKNLKEFLQLENDEQWEKETVSLFKIQKTYSHSAADHKMCEDLADKYFSKFPDFQKEIIALIRS